MIPTETNTNREAKQWIGVVLLFHCLLFSTIPLRAQALPPFVEDAPELAIAADDGFRVEKVAVEGGAEIITIFARQDYLNVSSEGPVGETPLVSVLRDTLGDEIAENDRLRYVWLHSYAKASLSQKVAAFVPFFYRKTPNKLKVGSDPPPPVIDIQSPNSALWDKMIWLVFKRIVLGEFGPGINAPAMQYRQNAVNHRRSAVASALTVLSLYKEIEGEKMLSEREVKDIQARLTLTDKTFGWHMQSENLERVHDKDLSDKRDERGHNWELLRQYAEAQGLYFDPLEMPDGSPRHAMLWTAASDVAANKGRKFDGRFLNIKNPWTDPVVSEWKGYTQVRWFDADNRPTEPDAPGATAKTMIPLALYGLDHPKIPVILVDFRDNGNPRKRELTRRILNDVASNVLSLSRFGGLPFFLGRFIYDFTTKRRGIDINQKSRLRSYAQLKLLLSLDASLDDDFRADVARRVESATINPLENGPGTEANLSRMQYENLMAYASRPDGLPKQIQDDRREEMTRVKHGVKGRIFFGMAHALSFGLYTHREKASPDITAQLDVRRQLDFHERYVREVAFASARPEIDSDVPTLKRSLRFVTENGSPADAKTTRALAKIFAVTTDEDIQSLCLTALYRINNSSAKRELLAFYSNTNIDPRWREMCAHYLKLALKEGQHISKRDAEKIAGIAAN